MRDHLQVQEDLHSEVVRIYRAIWPSQLPPQGCPLIWSLLDPEPQRDTLARSQSNQQWPEPDLRNIASQNLDCTLEEAGDFGHSLTSAQISTGPIASGDCITSNLQPILTQCV